MKELDAEFYDERWLSKLRLNSNDLIRFMRILEYYLITGLREPKALDLGCGNGWIAGFFSNFCNVRAIDFSKSSISVATRKYPSVKFKSGDLFETFFEENDFDIVISNEVIEHVHQQQRYIEIASSYLKKGGYLILSTPNRDVVGVMTQELVDAGIDPRLQPVEKWLSYGNLRSLLLPHFKIVKMDSYLFGQGHSTLKLRLFNSPKINAIIRSLGLKEAYDVLRGKLRLGVHLSVLCRKVR